MDKELLRLLSKGREHYGAQEYERAETCLLKVVAQEDGFADAWNMLGVIYYSKGQVSVAKEYFEKAVNINSRYTDAVLNLAVTYNENGQYTRAKQVIEELNIREASELKDIEPYARGKLANMHAELGRAYVELQNLELAAKEYRMALDLCPDFVDIRTQFGQVLRDSGGLEEARNEFVKVKQEKPGYIPARMSLGMTYFLMGERLSAKDEWESVLSIDPDNKAADMYIKMVSQLIAQQEAEAAGMHLEVERLSSPAEPAADELDFSFEGEKASLSPASDIVHDVESEDLSD